MSSGSALAWPSAVVRKNSHSPPLFITTPWAAACATTRFSVSRGPCSTGLPFITRSEASQPTSGFHGNCTKLVGSGTANRSGSAGVMSSQVANPANPAPLRCIPPIAAAGTSLARCAPNRSVKEIRK